MTKHGNTTKILITAALLLLLLPTAAGTAGAATALPLVTSSFDTQSAEPGLITYNGQNYILKGTDISIPVNLTISGGTLYSYAVDARLSGSISQPDVTLRDLISWTSVVNGHKLASTVSVANPDITDTTVRLFNITLINTDQLKAGIDYTLSLNLSFAAVTPGSTSPVLIEETKELTFKTGRLLTLSVNDLNRGTIGVLAGTRDCSDYTKDRYTIAAPEGETIICKISPVQGYITTSLKQNGQLTTGGSGNELVINSLEQNTQIEAVFDIPPPEKKPEPEAPKELTVTVTDQGQQNGITGATVEIDGDSTLETDGQITISATLTPPPEQIYTPVPDTVPDVKTLLIVEIISNVQPQESFARVTLSIEKSRVTYPDTVRIYHNVQTSPGVWQQKEVQDQKREPDTAEDYVYSFLTPSFSYFTFTEKATPPAPAAPVSDGGTDIGSVPDTGSYLAYPRPVTDGGYIDFGTSPVFLGVDLPKGTTGTVTLRILPRETQPDAKTIYAAAEITAPDTTGTSLIYFQIDIARITAAGYTKNDIVLSLTDGNTGKSLKTMLSRSDDTTAVYAAETDSFGLFAIVYEVGGTFREPGPAVPTEAPTTPPAEHPTAATPGTAATAKPAATPAPLGAVVAGLGAAAGLLGRKED